MGWECSILRDRKRGGREDHVERAFGLDELLLETKLCCDLFSETEEEGVDER